ncbi:hypothetical protein QZH41_019421, partial [Actinostola sp. cb2023]
NLIREKGGLAKLIQLLYHEKSSVRLRAIQTLSNLAMNLENQKHISQTEGEGVAEFIAGLRKLTEHCNFRETLDDMLRDRLVCGLNDEKIQRRLLAEPGLTYKRAVQLALAFESASKNTLDLKSKVETAPISVHQVNKHETPQECYRCGGRHNPSQCRFREVKCYNCDKKGHIEKMCRGQKQKAYHGHDQVNKRRTDNKAGSQPTHLLKESNTDEYTMYHMKGTTNAVLQPLEVDIELCGEPHKMEIDTGATKTIISETTYSELPENVKLVNSNAILSTYTGEKIPVIGKVTVPVKYGEQNHNLSALVVQGEGPNLLGRDWLHVIKLNWQTVFKVNEGNTKLAHVLETHNEVFKEGLGTLRGTEAKIYVDSNTQPRFVKARPVPYAMKEKIERELDRLVSEGILSPVEFSEWAAPIVPVLKPNGSIRICGDYKCTVNQVSKLDNYPIPKTEDLLATLGGGNKFTKLDMSQAYQQMTLDEQSKSYTTINTHKGLYQYNRLPFGISSAPGIFQRTMESLLQGIPHVIVRIDDILVSATIEKLRETFANHGLPKTIVSDNGSNFTSAEFEQFTVKNGIKHIKVAPYHPASNGQAERAVRIFKEGFEKMEGGSIRTKLSRFLLRYRITPHSTTGVPPAQLLMKRHLRTQLDLVRPSVGDRVQTKQEQQKAIHDNHAKARDIQIDDPVYIRDFREKKAWLPGVVIEKTGPVSSKIELQDGTIVRRHQDHIRTTVNESKRPEPDIPEMPTLEDTPPEEMSPQEITPQATQTSSTPKP